MKEKVIGIMGGMGPEAGIDLFSRITSQTHAKCDTDHLHVILDLSLIHIFCTWASAPWTVTV